MTHTFDVVNAKSRLSELLNRASYGNERFLIRRHGRAVAAIVSTDDLARLEMVSEPKRGLLAAVEVLAEFSDWEESMEQVIAMRGTGNDRVVDIS